MITKEQIEKAAREYRMSLPYCDDPKIRGMSIGGYDGFIKGAVWRINSVWHSADVTPDEDTEIVLIDKRGEWYNILYSFDGYDDAFGRGWESCVRTYDIDKWAYLDDLMPTKGGEG